MCQRSVFLTHFMGMRVLNRGALQPFTGLTLQQDYVIL